MNSQKFILGGIAGGIVYFLIGYLFYGLLLKNFFNDNGMVVDMDKMVWWAMIAGNLAGGFLLAYILSRSNATSAVAGASIGFIVGLLMSLSFDLMMYGIGHVMSSMKALIADVAVSAVLTSITGAIIGLVMGMSRKTIAVA
jgi:uncharacterized protein YacL